MSEHLHVIPADFYYLAISVSLRNSERKSQNIRSSSSMSEHLHVIPADFYYLAISVSLRNSERKSQNIRSSRRMKNINKTITYRGPS